MTEKDARLLFAPNKRITIKLELLDSYYQVIENLQGKATQFSMNVSSDSDIRRTASITLMVEEAEMAQGISKKVWLDNMVRAYALIEDVEEGESEEYLIGSFLFTESAYSYDATTQELSLNLVDMMASATSARGSQIGYDLLIPYGSNMRGALISTVARFSNFKRYDVPEFEDAVYYDVEVPRGSYGHTALTALMAMYPTYQMFYDREGVFVVSPIPTKIEDPVEIDADIMDNILIAEKKNESMTDVANVIEIWGDELEPDYVATECVRNGRDYNLTIPAEIESLEVNSIYSFTPDENNLEGQRISVNGKISIPVYIHSGDGTETPISADAIKKDINYCVQYAGNDKFYFMGESLIHVIAKEVLEEPSEEEKERQRNLDGCEDIIWVVNPLSKYAIEKLGEIKRVYSDGDYVDIYTTQLGFERAKYELWKKTRQQDTVTLQTLLIPTLDVNMKIAYTSSDSQERAEYLVKSFSGDFVNGVMTIEATRFYPYYPF